jgi:TP901 family phage tail tape measure protein
MPDNPGLVLELSNLTAFEKEMEALEKITKAVDKNMTALARAFDKVGDSSKKASTNIRKVANSLKTIADLSGGTNKQNIKDIVGSINALRSAKLSGEDVKSFRDLAGGIRLFAKAVNELSGVNIEGFVAFAKAVPLLGRGFESLAGINIDKNIVGTLRAIGSTLSTDIKLKDVSGMSKAIKVLVDSISLLQVIEGERIKESANAVRSIGSIIKELNKIPKKRIFLPFANTRLSSSLQGMRKFADIMSDALRKLSKINSARAIQAIASFNRSFSALMDGLKSIELASGDPVEFWFRRRTRLTKFLQGIRPFMKIYADSLKAFSKVRSQNFAEIGVFTKTILLLIESLQKIPDKGINILHRKNFRLLTLLKGMRPFAKMIAKSVRILTNVKGDPKKILGVASILQSILKILDMSTKEIDAIDIKQFGKVSSAVGEISKMLSQDLSKGSQDFFDLGKRDGKRYSRGFATEVGIDSPSTVFYGFGKDVVAGFMKGVGHFAKLGLNMGKKLVTSFAKGFSSLFKTVSRNILSQFNNLASNLSRKFTEIGDKMQQTGQNLMRGGLATLAAGGFAGFIQGQMISSVADFDAVTKQIQVFGKLTTQELENVQGAILDFSAATKFGPAEAADAFLGLQKAGLGTAEALSTIQPIGDLAVAGTMDLASATNLAIQSMNGFGLETTDMTRIVNAFVAAADISTADVSDLGQAIGFVGPIANQAGISIEEVSTAIALLNDRAITGERAGTGLRAILQSILSPTEKAAGVLDELGIATQDASGNFVGMESLLVQFSGAVSKLRSEGLGDVEIIDQLSDLGDRNAISALFALISDGTGTITDLDTGLTRTALAFEEYGDALGEANTASAISTSLMDTLQGAMISLRGSVEALLIRAFQPLVKGVFKDLVQQGIDFVNSIGEIDQAVLSSTAALVTLGTVLVTLTGVAKILSGVLLTQLAPGFKLLGVLLSPAKLLGSLSTMVVLFSALLPLVAALGAGFLVISTIAGDVRDNVGGAGTSFQNMLNSVRNLFSEIVEFKNSLFEFVGFFSQGADNIEKLGASAQASISPVASFFDSITNRIDKVKTGLNEIGAAFDFFVARREKETGTGIAADIQDFEKLNELTQKRNFLLEQGVDFQRAWTAFDTEDDRGLFAAVVQGERAGEGFIDSFIEQIEAERGVSPLSEMLREERENIVAVAQGDADAVAGVWHKTFEEAGQIFDVGSIFDAGKGLGSIRDVLIDMERVDPGSVQELIDDTLSNPEEWSSEWVTAMNELNGSMGEFEDSVNAIGGVSGAVLIKSGDTLSSLAAEYGTTVEEILKENPELFDPNLIFAGQELIIPGIDEASEEELLQELADLEKDIEDEMILSRKQRRRKQEQELTEFQKKVERFAQTGLFKRLFGEDDMAMPRAIKAAREIENSFKKMGKSSRAIGKGLRIAFGGDSKKGLEELKNGISGVAFELLNIVEIVTGFDFSDQLQEALAQGDLKTALSVGIRELIRGTATLIEPFALFAGEVLEFFLRRALFGMPKMLLNVFGIEQFNPIFEKVDMIAESIGNVFSSGLKNAFAVAKGEKSPKEAVADVLSDIDTEIKNNPVLSNIADTLDKLKVDSAIEELGKLKDSIINLFSSQEFKNASDQFGIFMSNILKLGGAVIIKTLQLGFQGLRLVFDEARPVFQDIADILEPANEALEDFTALTTGDLTVEDTMFSDLADDLEALNPFLEIFTDTLDDLKAVVSDIAERDDLDSVAIGIGAIALIFAAPAIIGAMTAFAAGLILVKLAIAAFDPFLDTLAAVGDLVVALSEGDLSGVGDALSGIAAGLLEMAAAMTIEFVNTIVDIVGALSSLMGLSEEFDEGIAVWRDLLPTLGLVILLGLTEVGKMIAQGIGLLLTPINAAIKGMIDLIALIGEDTLEKAGIDVESLQNFEGFTVDTTSFDENAEKIKGRLALLGQDIDEVSDELTSKEITLDDLKIKFDEVAGIVGGTEALNQEIDQAIEAAIAEGDLEYAIDLARIQFAETGDFDFNKLVPEDIADKTLDLPDLQGLRFSEEGEAEFQQALNDTMTDLIGTGFTAEEASKIINDAGVYRIFTDELLNAFSQPVESEESAEADPLPFQKGMALAEGVAQGVEDNVDLPVTAVEGMATDMTTAFDDALEIESPSKVMERKGEDVVLGFVNGMVKAKSKIQTPVSDILNELKVLEDGAKQAAFRIGFTFWMLADTVGGRIRQLMIGLGELGNMLDTTALLGGLGGGGGDGMPTFAEGGFTGTGTKPFLAMLHPNEIVVPLEKLANSNQVPSGLMNQPVGTGGMSTGTSIQVTNQDTIQIFLDGTEISDDRIEGAVRRSLDSVRRENPISLRGQKSGVF